MNGIAEPPENAALEDIIMAFTVLWWMVTLCVLTVAEQLASRDHILRRGAGGGALAGLIRLGPF